MPTPKVSLVIPVYNGARYLPEMLASLAAQDFADCEILFSDDGSTDNSVELIKAFAARDPRVRWWRNEKNLGLTANFNHCLREARGEFVKFMLQDDKFLVPDAVSQLVAALERSPRASLAVSASHVIDEASAQTELRNYFPPGVHDGKIIIHQCLEQAFNPIGEPSLALFRRAQARRGFDPDYRQIVDLEMWFHLLERGDFAYLTTPLVAFRIHPHQQSAVNQRAQVGQHEHVTLLETYLARPWMRRFITRQMLFNQLYHFRGEQDERSRTMRALLRTSLPPHWYAAYWLKRKLFRPFWKLRRWWCRQQGRPIESHDRFIQI